jgi:hypothetical protein
VALRSPLEAREVGRVSSQLGRERLVREVPPGVREPRAPDEIERGRRISGLERDELAEDPSLGVPDA